MAEYACPSCGAPMTFRSSFSVYAVCSFCGSTVLRTDRDVSLIGTMADLPDEMTPFQVGTGLSWHTDTYTLAGRVRMGWADGAWNEWFMDSANSKGWLSEAQGFLALAFETPVPRRLDAPVALGDVIEIAAGKFRVSDIKQAVCIGSEGELPFHAPPGRTATYYDMLSPAGGFAGLEQSGNERRLYVGDYVAFDDLRFTNLRDVEGWRVPHDLAADGFPRPPPR
jgi:hypothetical protein